MKISVFDRVEKIVVKGENAGVCKNVPRLSSKLAVQLKILFDFSPHNPDF